MFTNGRPPMTSERASLLQRHRDERDELERRHALERAALREQERSARRRAVSPGSKT